MNEQTAEKGAGRASIAPTEQEYADARSELVRIFAEQYVTGNHALTATVLRATEGMHGKLIDAIIESGWENAEHTALRDWAFGQLERIINAVRGKPKPLHQHSLHDVAQRVEKAMRTRVTPREVGAP